MLHHCCHLLNHFSSHCIFLYFTIGWEMTPPKLPPFLQVSRPPPSILFLGPTWVQTQNGIWIGLAILAQVMVMSNRPSYRYFCSVGLHLCTACSCAEHLTVESYTIIIFLQSYFYYWYSITHWLFHSRLKSFLFCESSLQQPFLCLLQDSLYGFPSLLTATSEHIRLFYFLVFFCFYTFLVVGSVR